MKNILGAAALIAAGVLGFTGSASAASLSGAASVQQTGVERIDFRPFRHCHGSRWDRRCHGGGALFFGRDRDRREYRGRDNDRRDYGRRDRRDRGDRYND
jgi:hypothetical protein